MMNSTPPHRPQRLVMRRAVVPLLGGVLAPATAHAESWWSTLVDTEGFPARWRCGEWTPAHGNLHIVSDLLIFGAYMAIPIVLTLIVRKRKDLPFPGILWLFVTFILACGFTHLLEAAMFWWPAYRAMGATKAMTAAVSWLTVGALIPTVPKVLDLRNPLDARLAALVESAQDAIISVDPQGQVTTWNRAASELFGLSAAEAQGQRLLAVTGIDLPHSTSTGEIRAHTARGESTYEGSATGPNQRSFDFSASTSPIVDAGGHLVGTSVIVRDITEWKESEKQLKLRTLELERSNRDLDQFAYVASHDLKAPLRAIGQLASWLEEDLGQAVRGESREHLSLLQSRTQRMGNLLDSLLEYARAGYSDLELQTIEIEDLVQDCRALLNLPSGFEIHVDSQVRPFRGYRIALQQVLINLLQNAVKHHDADEGTIWVRAIERGSRVLIGVSDDGPGIAPEYQGRIFQLFQTLRPRDEVEGSGVGLALVQKLVERFGGTISVDSNIGRGASFLFDWPMQPDNEVSPGSPRSAENT